MPSLQNNVDRIMAIVAKIECLDRVFSVSTRAGMIFLCVLYIEKDVNTGREEHQRSRQWLIEPSADETAVVDTAFACVMRSYDHVVQEHFSYEGRRVFSPHFTIQQRLAMAPLVRLDQRQGAPRLTDDAIGTEREVDRLEAALRWIGANCEDAETVRDNVSRALRGKSVP